MKLKTVLIPFFTFIGIFSLQAQNYVVQVAAFITPVEESYFNGIDNVSYMIDKNDIHRYYIMGFTTLNDAKVEASKLKKRGFTPVIIDSDEVNRMCKLACDPAANMPIPIEEIKAIKWVFFDFGQSELRPNAFVELRKLARVLNENPLFTVELGAHTDAKGTNEFNMVLSERRANNAKNYLTLTNSISAVRVRAIPYGEMTPIAKNALANGKDTELGRQFNRRVEIKIYDENAKQLNLTELPVIPTQLQDTRAFSMIALPTITRRSK
jgi:outer membrane protein OmpA-like peptidoglycan-associated protein